MTEESRTDHDLLQRVDGRTETMAEDIKHLKGLLEDYPALKQSVKALWGVCSIIGVVLVTVIVKHFVG